MLKLPIFKNPRRQMATGLKIKNRDISGNAAFSALALLVGKQEGHPA